MGCQFFILSLTIYLSEKFPSSLGARYLRFLKVNSSPEVFNKYCGNPWSALKTLIKNPDFIKVAAKNGGGKFLAGTGAAVVAEHTIHNAKLGQIFEYEIDKYINNGYHSSFYWAFNSR